MIDPKTGRHIEPAQHLCEFFGDIIDSLIGGGDGSPAKDDGNAPADEASANASAGNDDKRPTDAARLAALTGATVH